MQPHDTTNDIPYGYCQCGCGQLAPLAPRNDKRRGYTKGQPVHFVHGHHSRGLSRPHKGQSIRTMWIRFWQKVDRRGPNECWEWTGNINKTAGGYGQLVVAGKSFSAHRLSWEFHNAPIPDGLHCLHHCDNPACVNPHHLFLGTHADNMRDMAQKKRINHKGERNSRARLSASDIVEIRKFSQEGITQDEIARIFGITQAHVSSILLRKQWSHIP